MTSKKKCVPYFFAHLETSLSIFSQIAMKVSTSYSYHFIRAKSSLSKLKSPSKSTTSSIVFFIVFFVGPFFFGEAFHLAPFDFVIAARPLFFHVARSLQLSALVAASIVSSSFTSINTFFTFLLVAPSAPNYCNSKSQKCGIPRDKKTLAIAATN